MNAAREDERFEQRAVDPAAAYGPAILLAALIMVFSAFVGTESVALSFGRQAALGANVAGIYPPSAGLIWELRCAAGRWPVCRVPSRLQYPMMDSAVVARWIAQSQRRRAATMAHFAVQHVVLLIGTAVACFAGFGVGRWRYRNLEQRQRSKLHGSSEFATWEELRDAGYIAGVAPVPVKKA